MPVEKSAGAVVFHRDDGKIEFLLLQNSASKTWGFSKGLIDQGEKLQEAALREIKEETGLDTILLSGFKETIRYFMKAKYDYQLAAGAKPGETILKFVTYFLAETKSKEVKLSFEHNDYKWLVFDEAKELLKNKQSVELLTKAEEFIAGINHD